MNYVDNGIGKLDNNLLLWICSLVLLGNSSTPRQSITGTLSVIVTGSKSVSGCVGSDSELFRLFSSTENGNTISRAPGSRTVYFGYFAARF